MFLIMLLDHVAYLLDHVTQLGQPTLSTQRSVPLRSVPHANQDKRSCPHNDRFHIFMLLDPVTRS